jgi:hypothetical protein
LQPEENDEKSLMSSSFLLNFSIQMQNHIEKKRNVTPSIIPVDNKTIPWKPESKNVNRPVIRPASNKNENIPMLFMPNILFFISFFK